MKFKKGDKIQISGVTYYIIQVDSFGKELHYGILGYVPGADSICGWIPCRIADQICE